MVEVLIVGAGPAGAVAALTLARAGVRVLVVDRARFPRHKLCGDTLNPGALRLLARLGVADATLARGLPIEGMLLTSASGVQVRGLYGRGLSGRSLVRRDLDQALIDAAVRAGAQFQDDVRVVGPIVEERGRTARVRGASLATRDGRTLRVPALVTIAADGRRSPIAFVLGLARQPPWPRRWAIGGYMTGVDLVGPVGEMHIRSGHYLGVAPVPGGLANVCYVSERRRDLATPARALVDRLSADPLLRDRVAHARLESPVTMMGPLAVDVPVAGMPGLLLAGDAAGFVDPMTGDGLRFALRSAEFAAEVAQRCLDEPAYEGHVALTARRAREFSGKYRVNRCLRAIVASDAAVRIGALSARVAPGVLRRIIRYAGDVRVGPPHPQPSTG
jgi:flavin-dependent dehydrogenase